MGVGDEFALEGMSISWSVIEKLTDVVLIEHFMFLGAVIDANISLVGRWAGSLIIQMRPPMLEVVSCSGKVVIFLGGRCCAVGHILWSIHQSSSVPMGQTCHSVQRTQLEVSTQISDVYLSWACFLLGAIASWLRHRVTLFKPIACLKGELPMRTRGL